MVRKRPEAKQARHGWTARPPQPTRVTSESSQKAAKGRNAMFDFVGSHTARWSRTCSAHCPLAATNHETVDLVARTTMGTCIDDYESKERDVLASENEKLLKQVEMLQKEKENAELKTQL